MSYKISYEPQLNKKYSMRSRKPGKGKPVLLAALLCLLAVAVFVPLVRERVLNILLPGDPEITKGAVSKLVEQVRAGMPIGEAVTAFCGEILQGA